MPANNGNFRQHSGDRVHAMKQAGFTLAELLIGSLIGTVVAGGTMMAFVTATRLNRQQGNPQLVEASLLAQQTIERYRNHMACDGPWFDPATCAANASLPTAWTSDLLPAPASGGSETMLGPGAKRQFCVTQEDCDGVGGVGDCFAVQVRVCWGDDTSRCPTLGSSCT